MISEKIKRNLEGSSEIRAMFEEGERLRTKYGAANVYDFSLGNPDPEPPQAFTESLRALIDKKGIHSYMNNAGYKEVRQKIADGLNKKHSTSLSAENIVMTVGAGGALNVILKTILNPGDEVIVLAPFFVEYRFYIDNHGGKTVIAETDAMFQPDLKALEQKINNSTRAIIINSPNNPTGVVYGERILKEMSDLIEIKQREYSSEILLISDEPYRDIVYDGVNVPCVLNIFKNSVIAYSYSKSMSLPGERIGYIAANSGIDQIKLFMDGLIFANRSLGFVNAPSLMQLGIENCLEETVDVNIYKERRDILYSHLTHLGFDCIKPDGAFYLFPKCPIDDVTEFKNAALKHRIITVNGKGFGRDGYFRLSYCISKDSILNSLPSFTALAKEVGLQ